MPIFSFLSKEAHFVQRIRSGDREAERAFFDYCYEYCLRAQGGDDFFSQDRFQEAFLQIWTEIQDGRIFLERGAVWRQPKAKGREAAPMTCSLRSFIVDICKKQAEKEKRGPLVVPADAVPDLTDEDYRAFEREEEEVKLRIIHACIAVMSPHCREILTQFYVQGLSLENIMHLRRVNVSKDGLKTSKSKCLQRLKSDVVSTYLVQQMS